MSRNTKRPIRRGPHPRKKTPRAPAKTFPTLLHWRDAHNLSQRDAAIVLGMSQSMYARYEDGRKLARGDDAKKLLLATGVPLEVLVGVA